MKKISTLIIAALACCALGHAQDATDHRFEFTDKSGNIVANGSELTLSEVHQDPDGIDPDYIASGLYVKNVSGTASDYIRVTGQIKEMTNGTFQICFPSACIYIKEAGAYRTQNGTRQPGSISDLQAEWVFDGYGVCTVDAQIEIGTIDVMTRLFTKAADGPKVTLHFVHADPAGISTLPAATASPAARYSLDGRRLHSQQRGLSIVRQSDGTVRKVLVP